MSKRLLVILARGGSKRIKNKNIKNFLGKPIIFYSLNIAKKSKLYDKIHVSTESVKIYNIVNNLGYNIDFMRPKKLATDFVGSIKVLQFVFNEYKKKKVHFDEIWSLSACAPLIRVKDLIKAAQLLSINKTKAVLSVAEYNAPLEWAFEFKKKSNIATLKPLNPGSFNLRSQDLNKNFYDTGSFFGIKKKYLNNTTRLDQFYSGVVIPKSRAADIDDKDDWNLAKTLFKGLRK